MDEFPPLRHFETACPLVCLSARLHGLLSLIETFQACFVFHQYFPFSRVVLLLVFLSVYLHATFLFFLPSLSVFPYLI